MALNGEQVLVDYMNADFLNRLHLYIEFPEFRDDFLEIEMQNTETDFFAGTVVQEKKTNAN